MMLNKEEKTAVLLLTVGAIIMVIITLYLSTHAPKEDLRINGKVHIIYTGGEIEPDFNSKYRAHINQMPYIDVNMYDPPLQASDIIPLDWNRIAEDIGAVYNQYDAIIVVCGSDTLSYTASALSFMFENLSKPIILTDGNVFETLKLASITRFCEVMVSSNCKLLRGCRTVAKSLNIFASPNYPHLNKKTCLNPPQGKVQITFINPKIKVIVVKVFPGMDHKYLENLKKNNMHGIVLETYGTGHAPITEELLKTIHDLAEKGVVIVNISQCEQSTTYQETDLRLLEAGVLNGRDMTTSAAFAKLHYLLGNVEDRKLIGQLMETNFRGEMNQYVSPENNLPYS